MLGAIVWAKCLGESNWMTAAGLLSDPWMELTLAGSLQLTAAGAGSMSLGLSAQVLLPRLRVARASPISSTHRPAGSVISSLARPLSGTFSSLPLHRSG